MSIHYERLADRDAVRVKLDGKVVGIILRAPGGGYHYRANGGHFGEAFATIVEVQASLEGDHA